MISSYYRTVLIYIFVDCAENLKRRSLSMSYKAISESQRAGEHMQSPSTFLANTVLPAPINVIFTIIIFSFQFLSKDLTFRSALAKDVRPLY